MGNIINNQEQVYTHLQLIDDAAYQWSVDNNDIHNMQLVLRAYGWEHDYDSATKQIKVAKELAA